jgi:protease-4
LTADLRIAPGGIAQLRERAILNPEEAREEGLVSEILYFDELEDRLRGQYSEWRMISSEGYADVDRQSLGLTGKPKIAVVHAQGFVMSDGEDRYDTVVGLAMGADRVVDDLNEATDDDGVRAIVLRWDTGGGATDGGELISRAVARARKEKPVVVSIADVAASAGYMMSYPANSIVCPGNGITGSIGSITGKFNVLGLWEKLGLTYDDVSFAPNAFLFSELHDFTPAQRAIIEKDHWDMYNEWIDDIARARNLSFEEVDSVGRGRVWTGRQALDHGLVDALGGFDEALAEAKRLADLDEDAKVTLEHFPRERSPWELLMSGDLSVSTVGAVLWDLRESLARSSRVSSRFAYEAVRWE